MKKTKIEDLYLIRGLTETGSSYTCDVELNRDHEIYKGHFPDMPVTPGVCMLHLVKSCASQVTGRQLRYASIRSSKFLSAINPLEHSQLVLTFSLNESDAVQAMASVGGNPVFKLKAELTEG
ncbi:MAG: hydroxymyristoyl-ACP dehydratase [Tannerellaceae bacterium]|jgi:3-hydroxyacyl-[acyl-carrier-protein] dehydratase|nr:hydroxymyristoyl-ACP dehydratase [Tannerellaceae bacterium]